MLIMLMVWSPAIQVAAVDARATSRHRIPGGTGKVDSECESPGAGASGIAVVDSGARQHWH